MVRYERSSRTSALLSALETSLVRFLRPCEKALQALFEGSILLPRPPAANVGRSPDTFSEESDVLATSLPSVEGPTHLCWNFQMDLIDVKETNNHRGPKFHRWSQDFLEGPLNFADRPLSFVGGTQTIVEGPLSFVGPLSCVEDSQFFDRQCRLSVGVAAANCARGP